MTKEADFVKLGNKIIAKPAGLDYNLENEKVYNLKYDRFGVGSYFEEDGSLNLPDKLYFTEEDEKFINKVVKYHSLTTKQTTGVMLDGIKGTGKTVIAKVIAQRSKLPIIVVNADYPSNCLNDFFTKFKTEVAIIFDEVDKNWYTEDLLTWLDGVQATAKKLALFTCNDICKTNEFLQDRCSRIRYSRHFEANDNARFLKNIIKDKGIKDIEETYKFVIDNFKLLSIDNINSFLDEKVMFPEFTNEELLFDMNISSCKIVKSENNENHTDEVCEVVEHCCDYDDEDYKDDWY